MKSNLLINKQIIDGLIKSKNMDDIEAIYNSKLKEENTNLLKIINNNRKDYENLKNKLTLYESLFNEKSYAPNNVKEDLENKIFTLENKLEEKENLIKLFNTKFDNFYKMLEDDENAIIHEIFVIQPVEASSHVYDELMLYKSINENLILLLKENKQIIKNHELKIEV